MPSTGRSATSRRLITGPSSGCGRTAAQDLLRCSKETSARSQAQVSSAAGTASTTSTTCRWACSTGTSLGPSKGTRGAGSGRWVHIMYANADEQERRMSTSRRADCRVVAEGRAPATWTELAPLQTHQRHRCRRRPATHPVSWARGSPTLSDAARSANAGRPVDEQQDLARLSNSDLCIGTHVPGCRPGC